MAWQWGDEGALERPHHGFTDPASGMSGRQILEERYPRDWRVFGDRLVEPAVLAVADEDGVRRELDFYAAATGIRIAALAPPAAGGREASFHFINPVPWLSDVLLTSFMVVP
jgi:hypothetical protein